MLKENFLLGQYFPGNSSAHRLDARSKLIISLLYMAALFTANDWRGYLTVSLVFVAVLAFSRVPVSLLWKGMRIIVIFVVITVILNALMIPGEKVLWQYKALTVTYEGLMQGFKLGLRLLLLVAFASLLTLVTKPLDLTDGLERLLSPLEKIKVPTHEIAMIMSIALRFIPTILDEMERIMLAQRARGAEFGGKKLKEKLAQIVPLMVPLFVSSFRRADDLAQAMESRCYFGGEGRTHWRRSKWQNRDTVALVLFAALWLALLVWRLL